MVTAHSLEPVVLPSAAIVKTWFVRYADNQLFNYTLQTDRNF